MNLPNSFYEAVVQGFAGTDRIDGRRSLFLFLVNHSEPMLSPLPETSKSRIDTVVEVFNRMKVEMAQVDDGRHLAFPHTGTQQQIRAQAVLAQPTAISAVEQRPQSKPPGNPSARLPPKPFQEFLARKTQQQSG